MKMQQLFQTAYGSIAGAGHKRAGKNNQDAFCLKISDDHIIAVVCDGCSDGKHNDVGAKIGSRLIVENILLNLDLESDPLEYFKYWRNLLEMVQDDVLSELKRLSKSIGHKSWKETIYDYFLFTVVGTIITPDETIIFSTGDGVFIINGDYQRLGPFPRNAPPYMSYKLLLPKDLDESYYSFKVSEFPTEEINSILLGTDGVVDLIESSEKNIPGRDEKVGDISQFWKDDFYFQNFDNIRRKLFLINQEIIKPNWESRRLERHKGLLADDTTLMVIRRKDE